jgi:hypothetical protein
MVSEYSAPAPVVEKPMVSEYSAPAPVVEKPMVSEYSAPAPRYEAPAAPRYEAPAPVVLEKPMVSEYSAPAPVVEKPAITQYSAPAAPIEEARTTGFYGNTRLSETILPEEAGVYSPEFNHICKRLGLRGLTVFYKPHPTDQKHFIQCDDFGVAFLRTCPSETVFTENLVCERLSDLHVIHRSSTYMRETGSSYGSASLSETAPKYESGSSITSEEMVPESLEFKHMCVSSKRDLSVFYWPHPTSTSMYIQCDASGRAFVKTCIAGTIFTENLTCEKINELHKVWKSTKPMMENGPVASSPYGISNLMIVSKPIVSNPFVEWTKESLEFRSLCESKRVEGTPVFYLRYPVRNDWFIQCDESGRAFVRTCMTGTIFTENLACEKVGELHEIWRPTKVESMRSTGYAAAAPVETERPIETTPIETPVETPLPVEETTAAPIVEAPLPIQTPVASIASYGGETVNYGDNSFKMNRVAKVKAFMSTKY